MKSTIRALLAAAALLGGTAPFAPAADVPEDIADMKVQDLRAGGDDRKRYFVIQRPGEAPKEGWRTLFVLPGGSGDTEFQPFVTRIAKNALPEGYLVVQLVAPVWTPQQAKNIVWPGERSGVREAKFSTQDFFLAVRADLAKAQKLDPRYSFTLTWSSSGMSGYGVSLHPKAGITGTFVAMSVFQRDKLPSLSPAKGRPYYIYHSPQDFIPLSHAENARDAFKKAGASVELQTYQGGHGWQGDPFAAIRKGIDWLEQQIPKKAAK